MKTLTGADRIFKTLELQEPDRVPHFDLGLDRKVREAILPGASYDEAMEYFDWDAVLMDEEDQPGYRAEILKGGKYFRDQWGIIKQDMGDVNAYPVEPAIKSEKYLDTWRPPDPDESWRYEEQLNTLWILSETLIS